MTTWHEILQGLVIGAFCSGLFIAGTMFGVWLEQPPEPTVIYYQPDEGEDIGWEPDPCPWETVEEGCA